jgi:hypothetical protein
MKVSVTFDLSSMHVRTFMCKQAIENAAVEECVGEQEPTLSIKQYFAEWAKDKLEVSMSEQFDEVMFQLTDKQQKVQVRMNSRELGEYIKVGYYLNTIVDKETGEDWCKVYFYDVMKTVTVKKHQVTFLEGK